MFAPSPQLKRSRGNYIETAQHFIAEETVANQPAKQAVIASSEQSPILDRFAPGITRIDNLGTIIMSCILNDAGTERYRKVFMLEHEHLLQESESHLQFLRELRKLFE